MGEPREDTGYPTITFINLPMEEYQKFFRHRFRPKMRFSINPESEGILKEDEHG